MCSSFLSLLPTGLSYRWLLNEFPNFIPADGRRFVSQTTGNLYIAKTEASDLGNYSCFATSHIDFITKSVFSKFSRLSLAAEGQCSWSVLRGLGEMQKLTNCLKAHGLHEALSTHPPDSQGSLRAYENNNRLEPGGSSPLLWLCCYCCHQWGCSKIEMAPGTAWAGSCTPGTAGDFLPLVTSQRCS